MNNFRCEYYGRWETKARFYEIEIGTDLLGDSVLTVRFGGLMNRRGAAKSIAVGNFDKKLLNKLYARRASRDYIKVAEIL